MVWFSVWNPTGQLLQANGEALGMEAGLDGQLFHLPQAILPCLMDMWLSQCWSQCHQLQITVTTDIQEFMVPCQSNKELIWIFLQDGTRGQESSILNRCRMYLQVIFLSNVCNGNGNWVEQSYWEGKQINTNLEYHWPQTSSPMTAKWQVQHQRLMTGLSLDWGQTLPIPLRQWFRHTHDQTGFFINLMGDHLLSLQANKWYEHKKVPHHQWWKEYHRIGWPLEHQGNNNIWTSNSVYKQ